MHRHFESRILFSQHFVALNIHTLAALTVAADKLPSLTFTVSLYYCFWILWNFQIIWKEAHLTILVNFQFTCFGIEERGKINIMVETWLKNSIWCRKTHALTLEGWKTFAFQSSGHDTGEVISIHFFFTILIALFACYVPVASDYIQYARVASSKVMEFSV